MDWILVALGCVGSYLLGAVPVGFLLVRALRGQDLRAIGSGSTGATNAARVLGGKWFFVVYFLDFLKGFIPCWVAGWLTGHAWINGPANLTIVLCAICAIAGHNWPVYISFRGGKGVATGCGALLYLAPASLGAAFAVWAVVFLIWRYVSLASILASLTAVAATVAFNWTRLAQAGWLIAFVAAAAALVLFRHRANISRLLSGTENRAGHLKPTPKP
ncbi:MAG TPA: glycerol-3-phosphate 1-O-acyltransferase PlsY [Candidatus Brocadiia bacterium]|nr:glycerol-3-phosphate 1-O-acyltransferase PlsY [Candidatus Brocadiia bacterium]